jgi:cobalamin biosynthesis protein CbiM
VAWCRYDRFAGPLGTNVIPAEAAILIANSLQVPEAGQRWPRRNWTAQMDGHDTRQPGRWAMHVPDGFIDIPVSIAAGAIAAAGVGVCLRGARRELDDRTAPLAGLVASFIFAVQMLNFPVAAGTSGHLLGGALAVMLVGPFTGALCVAVVLLVQGLFFADGGLTALGVNIIDMSLVTVIVGYAVVRLLIAVLPKTRISLLVATFVGALLSVIAASVAFTLIYALGGTTDIPLGTVASAMIGVHVLIGIGEALITTVTVASILAVRPDLVRAARHLQPKLALRTGTSTGASTEAGTGTSTEARTATNPDATPATVTVGR